MIDRALLKYDRLSRSGADIISFSVIVSYIREVDSTSEIHGDVPSWWMGCSTKLHPHFPRPRN